MPRLTPAKYSAHHRYLRYIWTEETGLFGHLHWDEQLDLHHFFAPAKDLSEAELRTHRQAATANDRSLPQRAGRALAKLDAIHDEREDERFMEEQVRERQLKPVKTAGRSRQPVVYGVVRPEPDYEQIAKVLIEFARRQAQEAADEALKRDGKQRRQRSSDLRLSSMTIPHPDATFDELSADGRVVDSELVADPNQRPTHVVQSGGFLDL